MYSVTQEISTLNILFCSTKYRFLNKRKKVIRLFSVQCCRNFITSDYRTGGSNAMELLSHPFLTSEHEAATWFGVQLQLELTSITALSLAVN
jgi:hypothetical protein